MAKIAKIVASASSDRQLRKAYAMLEHLPPLPRRSGGGMPAAALLTPMLACLDQRRRAPIINSRAAVQEKLQVLGLRFATVSEQFDGFVNLIGQVGIRDAFDLDTSDMAVVVAALKAKPRSQAEPRRTSVTRVTRTLDERDDADVEFFRQPGSVTMPRLHHTMTNALRSFCEAHGMAVEQGSKQECMFDALIHEYDGDRHLLVEVKTDSEQPTCRLAVGQLFDYRRQIEDRARTDLAVLFPVKPGARAKAFFEDVGVRLLWFNKDMTAVTGLNEA
ncbi:MAG: hypothetical protein IPM54_08220 [Polyangiaceae bacterium]|nr:hypothetical protein [Polyangiaceae bacterium]